MFFIKNFCQAKLFFVARYLLLLVTLRGVRYPAECQVPAPRGVLHYQLHFVVATDIEFATPTGRGVQRCFKSFRISIKFFIEIVPLRIHLSARLEEKKMLLPFFG